MLLHLFILFIVFILIVSQIHVKMNDGNVCLVDYAITHTILKDKRYFLDLTLTNANVSTAYGIANIMLQNGTRFHINDALYYRKSITNLLNFKDICMDGNHIEIMNEGNIECLYITSIEKKLIVEKLSTFTFGLHHTIIKSIESYVVVN